MTRQNEAQPASLEGRHLAVLIGVNLVGGVNPIAAKVGLAQFPPILFTALRFCCIALLLLPLLRIRRGQMFNLLAMGLLAGPATFSTSFAGMSVIKDASTYAIAIQMVVPISTLLSIWMLGESVSWRRIAGITLSLGGMVIITIEPRVLEHAGGIALVVLSCVFMSLGMIYIKRLKGIRPLELQAWIAATGGPLLIVVSLLFESNQIAAIQQADWRGWGALLFTIFLVTLISHTAWYHLVSLYPVTSLAPLGVLTPVFGVFFGVTLMNDQLSPRMLIGSAVTLIGIFIILARERRLVDTGT